MEESLEFSSEWFSEKSMEIFTVEEFFEIFDVFLASVADEKFFIH